MKTKSDYLSRADILIEHRQAMRVWSVSLAIILIWFILLVLPPFLVAIGFNHIASPVFSFFGYICHQLPERSLYFLGHQIAVCSRCFGVYAGLLVGALAYPFWRSVEDIEPLPRIWLFVSIAPLAVDWALTAFGIWENTHLSRFLTGLILGIGCITYIIPALVEIERNIFRRRRSV